MRVPHQSGHALIREFLTNAIGMARRNAGDILSRLAEAVDRDRGFTATGLDLKNALRLDQQKIVNIAEVEVHGSTSCRDRARGQPVENIRLGPSNGLFGQPDRAGELARVHKAIDGRAAKSRDRLDIRAAYIPSVRGFCVALGHLVLPVIGCANKGRIAG